MVDYTYIQNDYFNNNCVTGDKDHLYKRLKQSIDKASKIDIIVAFMMESGVRLLEHDLKEAVQKGTSLRILCGNYLNITQPQALYLLKDSLGDRVDLRFYNIPNKSFHPKAYIFENKDGGEIFVGSSNVSRSALTSGIEWNYRICSETCSEDYYHFKRTFEDLLLNNSIIVDDNELKRYSKIWRRPKVFEDLEKLEDSSDEIEIIKERKSAAEPQDEFIIDNNENDHCTIIEFPRPFGAQIEALYELRKARLSGLDKGIVVAATGIGKTFLAAFDSKTFNKILFVAHREEILSQAERSFKSIRPEMATGYFSGARKDKDCNILFATVQTLGREEHLNETNFATDEFDYIVIDEFHHAVSKQYQNIIEYFKPQFLLGLTATPERMDNKDVFALCEYNIIYEIRLKEAINKGWLVPFRYYGIFDETNYDEIAFRNGKYDSNELEKALSINRRADLILKHYQKYNSQRALGFCSSRMHALFMTEYFLKRGISCTAVISGVGISSSAENSDVENLYARYSSFILERSEAINKLKRGVIDIIFSVDMFNEGLDIPEIDMVMLLRPTESPTVFLQQLGRGLRKIKDKKYLNVLDFIGNYKNIGLLPSLLTGEFEGEAVIYKEENFPDDCIIDFDFRIIDLLKKLELQGENIKDRLKEEYFKVKEQVECTPTRLEFFTYLEQEIWLRAKQNQNTNVFKDYLAFLIEQNEANEQEKELEGKLSLKLMIKIFIKTF